MVQINKKMTEQEILKQIQAISRGLTFLVVGKSLEDCRVHRNEWIERGCEL